jgi:hypothetical protein
MAKPRRNLIKTTKECPAPRSEAYTHRLTPVSTHLSFRWTLPLKTFHYFQPLWIADFVFLCQNFVLLEIVQLRCQYRKMFFLKSPPKKKKKKMGVSLFSSALFLKWSCQFEISIKFRIFTPILTYLEKKIFCLRRDCSDFFGPKI